MPQTGDGDDIERRGRGRGPLTALENAVLDAEIAIRERAEAGRAPLARQQRVLESAQARLREAQAAEEAEDAAEETVRTLTRGQKASITRRVNNQAREKFGTADLTKLTPQQRGSLTRTRNTLTREALEN
tara:strand:+ start:25207 stop:25596 length:390 start_codon:yes stop_codon:yes gene_type:complete